MDLKKTESNLDSVDSILGKIKKILIKHWGLLLLLGSGYLVYWFCGLVVEEMEKDAAVIEEMEQQLQEEYPEDYEQYKKGH